MSIRPTEIRLHQASRVLELVFGENQIFRLPCEYLRVFSPSAEVQGHGPGQDVLQHGKEEVNITAIEPVGHYAIKLIFDDGHNTGLYTWEYLHHLATRQEQNWQHYLNRLHQAGIHRKDTATSARRAPFYPA